MRRRQDHAMGMYTLAVTILFLTAFLTLVILGAGIYRKIVDSAGDNSRTRALTSYISTCVRNGDAEQAVYVENSDRGQVLVIADGDTGYGLRIYQYDGCLLEDYGKLEGELDPERAVTIGETATFSIDEEGALLSVTTDGGTVLVTRRSERY